ncbi:MAG: phosphoadenylyl-sulfate reductase [Acidobacteriota bacterium]|nr:phosphoadenylyl-sulfate reductase [Acidobacteriota bacterium]
MTAEAEATPAVDLAAVAADDARLERAGASEVCAWAVTRFGGRLVLACSFQDCVIVDLAVRADPGIEVVFLDTGAHFPETLAFVEVVRARYDLNLVVVGPEPGAGQWVCGSEQCCEFRKVRPLARALAGKAAWMTGLKRVDSARRRTTPVVGWDARHGAVKINPLATWSDADVAAYIAAHRLPVHPLAGAGYRSIGCAPTTRPVAAGEDPRAGRWSGTDKTECGLHL